MDPVADVLKCMLFGGLGLAAGALAIAIITIVAFNPNGKDTKDEEDDSKSDESR